MSEKKIKILKTPKIGIRAKNRPKRVVGAIFECFYALKVQKEVKRHNFVSFYTVSSLSLDKQVGAPTVPSAFIANSRE
jgi:hypothetical protein